MDERSAPERGAHPAPGGGRVPNSAPTDTSGGGQMMGFETLPSSQKFPCTVGLSPRVAKRNRCKDTVPYDHNRVILPSLGTSGMEGHDEDDYINASYIRGAVSNDGYILTQGPMLGTLEDFWHMLWSQRATLVVMLSRLVEQYQNQSYRYWPDVGDHLEVDELTVTTDLQDQRSGFISRNLVVTHNKTGERRQVTQLQFTSWPERSMPCVPTLVHFWKVFRRLRRAGGDRPPVLHSSNGSQRCGLIVALDILFNQWEAATSSQVDVHSCVCRLREDRMNLIGSEEEYLYLHHLVPAVCESYRPCPDSSAAKDDQSDVLELKEATLDADVQHEYRILQTVPLRDENKLLVNDNDDTWHVEDSLPEHCFVAGTGSIVVTCVPLHHCTVTKTEERPFKLRRSVSIQEYTEEMGLAGLLAPHCRRSFLVLPDTANKSQDCWQMLFDTGCRVLVRLGPYTSSVCCKDTDMLSTPDLTVTPLESNKLNEHVTESIVNLSSPIIPIPTVDFESPPDQPIKIFSLKWPLDRGSGTGSGEDAMFLVIDLVTRWLEQTSTALVAVLHSGNQSQGAEFCAMYNAVSDLQSDRQTALQSDLLLLVAWEVQASLQTRLSQKAHQRLHRACKTFSRSRFGQDNGQPEHQNQIKDTSDNGSDNPKDTALKDRVQLLSSEASPDSSDPKHPQTQKVAAERACSDS